MKEVWSEKCPFCGEEEMMTLRDFTTDDAEKLRRLYYQNMSVEAVRDMILEWTKYEYAGKYFEMFAVVDSDNIVGELSLFELSKSVVSIGVEIFPKFEEQGHGKQAVISALKICRSNGYKIVCDQVRTDNAASIALHKSLGFESDMYIYKNQKNHDVYLFLKSL